ncbi:hypothetical protein F2Q69_00030116 [Brassica cretica]|uniref:dolichyl-diphosphooligosaccharide--protein glycotransferase n=1 Tax=Brassica cretica TaxID=69181 RepID=A0A8S9S9H5_BRACR|nr:hypothetical protein F2Q69_00030116 [Brassica cretica]
MSLCEYDFLSFLYSSFTFVYFLNIAFILSFMSVRFSGLYINLVPLYVLVLLITGRFVGFQHVQSREHMAFFLLMQVFYFLDWVKYQLNDTKLFQTFLRITVTSAILVGAIALGVGTASGYISLRALPTAWSSFMFDYHILLFLFPAGLYFCFKRLSDATIFIVMYGLTSLYFAGVMCHSLYFAGVMVRLIFVATPAICLISAIAVSATVKNLTSLLRAKQKVPQTGSSKGPGSSKASSKVTLDQAQPFQKNGAIALLVGVFYLLSGYAIHCTWVTSEAYSSPSIVLAARGAHGNRIIFDDYREAYYWLTQNTPTDAKVMSWWDYGYQITAMGNRTVIVDNNTWNNTHIATVGRAMYDRARGVEIGNKDIKLEHLEEAYTTSNWIVRIYRVKPPTNRL